MNCIALLIDAIIIYTTLHCTRPVRCGAVLRRCVCVSVSQYPGPLDPDPLAVPHPVPHRRRLQPLQRLEPGDDPGKAGLPLVHGGVVAGVDVEGGAPVGRKAHRVLFVRVRGGVLPEGDRVQTELGKGPDRLGGRAAGFVGQGCRLDDVHGVENEGAAVEELGVDHFQKGVDGVGHELQGGHFQDQNGAAAASGCSSSSSSRRASTDCRCGRRCSSSRRR
mmetsp:Transcript_4924/g.11388  ORF Transcript_4924/g.11388 Transcript_4924/m.11388 type:complete len:220 (-) Transcript_4924:100-759(-)